MAIDEHDERETRCRLLGHAVPFGYCRCVQAGSPCRWLADCWHEQFDVAAFLREHFTPEQIEALSAPPKPKLTSIVELIQQAQQNAKNASNE